jgi:hypothetical protein
VITGNKGEWSEIYTFLKLLADGRLYAADADLNKIQDIYYPIIKILRSQIDGNWEYLRNGDIKVVDGSNGQILYRIPIADFAQHADILLNKIRISKGAFPVPETEPFLQSINCTSIKTSSSDKSDITLVVHDQQTGFNPTLGFSIKSMLGGASTLLNASGSTNFVFRITGQTFSDKDINRINAINTRAKIRDRILATEASGGVFQFVGVDNPVFMLNMQVIDSKMPLIVSRILLNYYKGNATDLLSLLRIMKQENPCNFNLEYNHSFYEYKLKNFLTDIALGMTPATVWNGFYDANGGYIVVRPDGEIVCYHIYNKNEFQDYLLNNTRCETPSSSRHGFGKLYRDAAGNLCMKLNLQIRFKD